MTNKLTLLTATGCRPLAWEISEKLAMRQTFGGPVRWIIVDDGEQAQAITFKKTNWELVVLRPQPYWQSGQNTQARNLAEGMRLISENDRVVVWEDDDSYHPDWLATVDHWLNKADLVGEKRARYYNVRTKKYRQLHNEQHASLCCTAMKGKAIQAFVKELKPSIQFIDLHLWNTFGGSSALYDSKMVVGIKGTPGRGGIGIGHKNDFPGTIDRNGSILRQWTGTNADLYT